MHALRSAWGFPAPRAGALLGATRTPLENVINELWEGSKDVGRI